MSVRTKSMTHLMAYAEGMITLDVQVRGLAEELFLGLKELAIEIKDSDEDLATAFKLSLSDMESLTLKGLITATGDKDATHSKNVTGYKNRKSELNKGINAGVDPKKFDTFSQYRKATDKATGSNADGRSGTGTSNPKTEGVPLPSGVTKLQSVTNGVNINETVKDSLNLFIKHLSKLNEADALEALQSGEAAIARLSKSGGRHSNAKKVANS